MTGCNSSHLRLRSLRRGGYCPRRRDVAQQLASVVHAEKAANGILIAPANATSASPTTGTHDSSNAG